MPNWVQSQSDTGTEPNRIGRGWEIGGANLDWTNTTSSKLVLGKRFIKISKGKQAVVVKTGGACVC